MLAVVLQWLVLAMPAWADEADEPVQWRLAPGRYLLIGRHPDSQRTYTGTARIDRLNDRLRLTRRIGGKESVVFGVVRRADPGEVYVLSFNWGAKPRLEMICVMGNDLDNYARLTCQWGRLGNPHNVPGMEAYFARDR